MKTLIAVLVSAVVGMTPLPTKAEPPSIQEPTAPKITVKKIDTKPIEQVKPTEITPISTSANIKEPDTITPPKAVPQQVTRKTEVAPSQSGTCTDWMQAAGITDIADASLLIKWESGCNPNAINPSSGACGLAQELPCGKSGCQLGNGACQMKWFASYVIGRYGSMANAVAFHQVHGWY